jgi:Rrf2 family protein
MKLLTKDTDYAISALIVLAKNKKCFVSAREISKKHNIPYQFLRSLLQKLIKSKLIESKEGMGGGVRLVKDARQINVYNLIQIFQGDFDIAKCMIKNDICPNRKSCGLRPEISRIELKISTEFKKITLAKLLKNSPAKSQGAI